MTFLPLNEPVMGDTERAAVLSAIDDGFVSTSGPAVGHFEREFSEWIGGGSAVAVASGTAALHLAFVHTGVGPGDLVAVSDLTFVASANAARYCGADLLLVGPDLASWNMNSARLYEDVKGRARRGDRIPKAIEVVHILGHPTEWEPIQAIHEEFAIPIIEDASEALGAGVLARDAIVPCGRAASIGCFSFNGNKMITTGGGGMVLCDDPEAAAHIRHLSTQAKAPGIGYEHDEIGFNYRMPALSAMLGRAQLQRLDSFLEDKKRLHDLYQKAFAESDIELQPSAPWAEPSFWLISGRLRNEVGSRNIIVEKLNALDIGVRPIWTPLHLQSPYRDSELLGCETSVELADAGLSFPSTPTLTSEDITRITSATLEVLDEC